MKRIYVLYARGQQTGGPEALHQLVRALVDLGLDASLVPTPCSVGRDRASAYAIYEAPEMPWSRATSDADSVVVSSETHSQYLNDFSSSRRVCWWLSIDNNSLFSTQRRLVRPRDIQVGSAPPNHSALKTHGRMLKAAFSTLRIHRTPWNNMEHIAQSQYAWWYLYCLTGTVPSLITDYILRSQPIPSSPPAARQYDVVYNVSKGGSLAKAICEAVGTIRHRGIEGMTPAEVAALLRDSSVYIDLGHQPGRDRMPREAVGYGSLSLVGKTGAAVSYEDCPLPDMHKFNFSGDVVSSGAELIRSVLANKSEHWNRQASYRRWVDQDRLRFTSEVAAYFVHGHRGWNTDGGPRSELAV